MKEINLSEMSMKSVVRLMMEGSDFDQFQKIAAALGKEKSTFQSWLDNESLRVKDLQRIADLLGYEIKLERK
ncbi:MAG TPA: hypothetical protein VNS08_17195 [Ureibacillus sp.]|nr:hypothetical protein [Ureibacillus sp.]